MSFTTLRGAGGVDVQFTGTDNRDILLALNEGSTSIDALGGNDTIQLVNTTGVVGAVTAKGGAGNDTVTALATAGGGVFARLANASITAGPGRDTITSLGAVSSVLKGNEDADNFVLSGNYTNSTIAGNQGEDSFTIGAAITLEDTKIQGGNDNDGVMNFTLVNGAGAAIAAIADAVDSTINGSKGVDQINIGIVTASTNLFFHGGQGDDIITSTNATSNGITYSGDLGNDVLSITGNASATVNGGDGNDVLVVNGTGNNSIDMGAGNDTYTDGAGRSTIAGGDGNDIAGDAAGNDTYDLGGGNDTASDGAGNDTYVLGVGNDTFTQAAGNGNDTITGGAGADTYNGAAGDGTDDFIFTAISDSGAGGSVGGTAAAPTFVNSFDTFALNSINAGDEIDITAVAQTLAGNTHNTADPLTGAGALTLVAGDITDVATANTFGAIQTALANRLTPSTTGINSQISVDLVTVSAGRASGAYLILNNSNSVLDSGDMMFEVGVADLAVAADVATTATTIVTAIEAGFA